MVKHLPTMQEARVQSLGQEDPLEKEMVTHSSTLAWKIPWTEECGGLQSMGSQRVGHGLATPLYFTLLYWTGYLVLGLPWRLSSKESPGQFKRHGSIPSPGRSRREENRNSLWYSSLENSKDRGAWWATVHGVPKESWLSDWTITTTYLVQTSLKANLEFRCFYLWKFLQSELNSLLFLRHEEMCYLPNSIRA